MGSRGSGRRGLAAHIVNDVRRLLREGIPKRAIARRLKISRQSVRRIETGTHVSQRRAKYERCKICGALVIPPCRKCGETQQRAGE